MRSINRITWCSVASLLAAAAFAEQPGRPQPGGNSPTPAQPGTPRAQSSGSYGDPTSILKGLEGMWRVDMRINPAQWDLSQARAGQNGTGQTPGVDRSSNDGRPGTPPSTDQPRTTTPSNPSDPNRPGSSGNTSGNNTGNNTGNNSGNNAATDAMAYSDGVASQGYCEKRWVLGGEILQESSVIPDLGAVMTPGMDTNGTSPATGTTPASTPSQTGRPSIEALEAGRMFQGLSFLSFDEATQRFDFVCMDTRQSGIHHATGTFDASTNRIEFDIQDVMGGSESGMGERMDGSMRRGNDGYSTPATQPGAHDPNDPNRPQATPGANPTNAANPSTQNPARTTPGQPTRPAQPEQANPAQQQMYEIRANNAGHGMGGTMHVVVEILSPDQHRVTMYRGNSGQIWSDQPMSPGGNSGSNGNNSGNNVAPGTDPSRTRQTGSNGQPSTTPSTAPSTNPSSNPTTSANNPPTGQSPSSQPNGLNSEQTRLAERYGAVIWQATYTRVDGAEASRYRQFIQRADQLMQATADDDNAIGR